MEKYDHKKNTVRSWNYEIHCPNSCFILFSSESDLFYKERISRKYKFEINSDATENGQILQMKYIEYILCKTWFSIKY